MQYIEARFGQRIATKETWRISQTKLLPGEMGIEYDTGLYKINHTTESKLWNELDYEASTTKIFTPYLDSENTLLGMVINCGGAAQVKERMTK